MRSTLWAIWLLVPDPFSKPIPQIIQFRDKLFRSTVPDSYATRPGACQASVEWHFPLLPQCSLPEQCIRLNC